MITQDPVKSRQSCLLTSGEIPLAGYESFQSRRTSIREDDEPTHQADGTRGACCIKWKFAYVHTGWQNPVTAVHTHTQTHESITAD